MAEHIDALLSGSGYGKKGMQIDRIFTEEGTDPFATVEWETRSSKIINTDGSIVFEMNNASVPKSWSQVASDIMISKYFRKAGCFPANEDGYTGETSAQQVIHRVVQCWLNWGVKYNYFKTTEDSKAFYDECVYMLLHQMAAPNSPQWFNTGLYEVYGITGPAQGQWYVDPETGKTVQSPDSYSRIQSQACFLSEVKDTLLQDGGILDFATRSARIFKGGSGVGSNLSKIRAKGEKLSGGGTSSGVLSFMKMFDSVGGAIKSGGTTRRSATLFCLDVDHPDIEAFIALKSKEEKKVQALIAAGYPSDYNGEAYETVTGQNSNLSVQVSDEFMQAVEDDKEWKLRARIDGAVMKTLKARDLWNQIVESAWNSADPGMQYSDTINRWNTVKNDGRINTSNPCSEYLFLDETACNLASINLVKFLDGADFNVDNFVHACRLLTIALDISVQMSHLPNKEMAEGTFNYRTLGLGYANLGALLMKIGLPYDSEAGRGWAANITSLLTATAYLTSADMARELGAFPRYEQNKESMLDVLQNHSFIAYGATKEGSVDEDGVAYGSFYFAQKSAPHAIFAEAIGTWQSVLEEGRKHGFRNSFTSCVAPTGCAEGATLISTQDGLLPLNLMGDVEGPTWQDMDREVLTDQGSQHANKFFINGLAETVVVQTHDGYRIQGTPEHRVRTVNPDTGEWGWTRFGDMRQGDIVPLLCEFADKVPVKVCLPILGELYRSANKEIRVPKTITPELAEILGYFMGNGNMHKQGVHFSLSENGQYLTHFSGLLEKTFGVIPSKHLDRGCPAVRINSTVLRDWWIINGFDKLPTINPTRYEPRIPQLLLDTNDPDCHTAFLRGLYDADATVTSGVPTLSSAYPRFVAQVRTLLLTLGIATHTGITYSGHGSIITRINTKNRFYANLFFDRIGFSMTDKQEKRRERIGKDKGDSIYFSPGVLDSVPTSDPLRREVQRCFYRAKGISRHIAERIQASYPSPELKQALRFLYNRVDIVAPGEEVLTYDISVPESNTYIANGFVSHNTIGLLMDCDTTGIEPDFSLVKFKKLAGGGYWKIANQSVKPALHNLGYSVSDTQDILTYLLGTQTLFGNEEVSPINSSTLEKHLSIEDTARIEKALPGAFQLEYLFHSGNIQDTDISGLSGRELLHSWGFKDPEIDLSNKVICGTQTMEGAPHLSPDHYSIFDTANKSGLTGTRFIAPSGHLHMLAVTQPFLSGASSKCVSGETLIRGTNGLTRLSDIAQDSAVEEGKFQPLEKTILSREGFTAAKSIYNNGFAQTFDVNLDPVTRIRGIAAHKILSAGFSGLEWKAIADINPGDWVAVSYGGDWGTDRPLSVTLTPSYGSQQKSFKFPTGMSPELALWLGMLTADGRITKSTYVVGFTKNSPEALNTWRELTENLFGLRTKSIRDVRTLAWGETIESKHLQEFLTQIGFSKNHVPDAVLQSSKETVIAYLSGLYLDGYISATLSLCQRRVSLLRDVAEVWRTLGFGVYASNNFVEETNYPVLSISAWCRREAANLLNWLEPHKQLRAEALENGKDRRVFPFPGIRQELMNTILDHHQTNTHRTIFDPRTNHLTVSKAKKTLPTFGIHPDPEIFNYDYRQVISVEPGAYEPTFDLSVPNSHSYVANGFMTHNTINLPNEATLEDVSNVYMEGWKLGIKSVALYRDGSKLSQPLSSKAEVKDKKGVSEQDMDSLVEARANEMNRAYRADMDAEIEQIIADNTRLTDTLQDGFKPAPKRRKLPTKRMGTTYEATVGGHKVYVRTGEYPDGSIGEIFIDMHKEGATLRALINAFAISISKGLQYGVPLEEYVDTFTFTRFEPAGMVTGHSNIKLATSIIDYVFRALAFDYQGREDLVQVPSSSNSTTESESFRHKPESTLAEDQAKQAESQFPSWDKPEYPEETKPVEPKKETLAVNAQLASFGDAPFCDTCGHLTIRSGSCYRCLNCGNSTGCS